MTTPHPAKASADIVAAAQKLIEQDWGEDARGLDPFAGVGTFLNLPFNMTGIELEVEWSTQHKRCFKGDATDLPSNWTAAFDFIVTSPCYGNRMADHHDAKDSSKRITYRHKLGRALSEGSAAGLQWGAAYRELHERAWAEATRVTHSSSTFILNISDHIRKGEIVRVGDWHIETLQALGWEVELYVPIATQRMGFGANRDARVPWEYVYKLGRVS